MRADSTQKLLTFYWHNLLFKVRGNLMSFLTPFEEQGICLSSLFISVSRITHFCQYYYGAGYSLRILPHRCPFLKDTICREDTIYNLTHRSVTNFRTMPTCCNSQSLFIVLLPEQLYRHYMYTK